MREQECYTLTEILSSPQILNRDIILSNKTELVNHIIIIVHRIIA